MTETQGKADSGNTSGEGGSTQSHEQITFFSFGMFIIDTIEYPFNPSIPTKHNLPGGAGLYALLGARLLTPPPFSHSLSWILDAGHDLPRSIVNQITSWQTSTRIRHDPSRSTTAAWNGYGSARDPEFRSFKYLTAKRRLDVEDLDEREAKGVGWHMVCSAQRAAEIVQKLESRRGDKEGKVIVWEPIPDLCSPEERDAVRETARAVDVISPNAEELKALFGHDDDETQVNQDELVTRLMGWNAHTHEPNNRAGAPNTACIVREGRDGSTIYFPPSWTTTTSTTSTSNDEPKHRNHHHHNNLKLHLPAYHTQTTSTQVLDPTGGGNTYLGALAVTLAYTTHPLTTTNTTTPSPSSSTPPPITRIKSYTDPLFRSSPSSSKHTNLITASIGACVAASFAIEQHGVPELQTPTTVQVQVPNEDRVEREELWGTGSGSAVVDRIALYLEREGAGIEAQIRRW